MLFDAMTISNLANLANITMPAAAICGVEDQDNGSGRRTPRAAARCALYSKVSRQPSQQRDQASRWARRIVGFPDRL